MMNLSKVDASLNSYETETIRERNLDRLKLLQQYQNNQKYKHD